MTRKTTYCVPCMAGHVPTIGAPVSSFAHQVLLPFDSDAPGRTPGARAGPAGFRHLARALDLHRRDVPGAGCHAPNLLRRSFDLEGSRILDVARGLRGALSLVVLWLGWMLPLEKRVWARRLSLHILFSLGFGVARTGARGRPVLTPHRGMGSGL